MGETIAARVEDVRGLRKLLIAIPTFRRIDFLEKLLDGIAEQRVLHDSVAIHVVVLDNDAARSAEGLVARRTTAFPFSLRYVSVLDPGLASVRNRALHEGREGFDFLAMIDDDECPEPQWIAELLATRFATGAAAIVGPVPPILPSDVPTWVRRLREREVPVHADRASLADGWSGNCLLDMRAIGALGVSFDRKLDFAGGEDQLFFRQLIARGGKIAYSARAVAWEHTPAKRRTLRFAVERSFRRGNTLTICDRLMYGRWRSSAPRAMKGLAKIVGGIAVIASRAIRRDGGGVVYGVCSVADGIGMLCGVAGITYQAYRRSAKPPTC